MTTKSNTTVITSSMIKLLVSTNRKQLVEGNLKDVDSYTAAASMLPLEVWAYEDDSFNKLRNEVDLIQKIGKSSYDKDFLPSLKGYTCFAQYIIDCWNTLSSMKGYNKAKVLSDVVDNNIIWLMVRYCELPKLVEAIASHKFRDTTDIQKLNELVLPSSERRLKVITALREAKGYRDLIKVTHALVLSDEELSTNFEQLTKIDLSIPYMATWSAWLYDEEGNRVRKLQDYSQPLTSYNVLNLIDSSPNDAVRSAIHVMNMQSLTKLTNHKMMESDIKLQQQLKSDEAKASIEESERKAVITKKVGDGVATYDELQEYLSW
ncbi:hypothetical protein ACMYSP_20130 [Klebsiella sp. R390]|uniref:hypothetical protein n=1 Tax=Klebsiella sp. R390 TaxID=2755400 RepID=UPI003DA8C212